MFSSPPSPSSSSSLWALIVGINEYQDPNPNLKNLTHAVSDAHAMRHFLQRTLRVPAAHILTLTDQRASYTAILGSFERHLLANPRVRPGDALLFYFAGHGARYAGAPGTDDGHSEALCPADRGVRAASGAVGYDIADSTLGRLLAALAAQKGSNITVILDCCHAGSGTRAAGEPGELDGLRARWAPPITDEQAVRAMRDDPEGLSLLAGGGMRGAAVWSAPTRHAVRLAAGPPPLRGADLTTHVLLAACRQSEQAYEDTKTSTGLFTAALLGALNKDGLSQLTYEGLMAKVLAGIPGDKGKHKGTPIQHPQCEGRNKQRAVFDGRALGWNRRLVPVALLSKGRVRIEAGAIHGVALGAEFGVWPEKSATIDPPRGRLVVTEVFSVYSFVQAEAGFAPQHGWYAGVSWWANAGDPYYPVHVAFREETAQDECQRVLAERLQLANSGQSRNGIEVAIVLGEPAVPLISVRDRVMKVERTDPCTGAVEVELPCPGPKEGLELLNRILRFELHLARTNPANPLLRDLELSIVHVDKGGTPVSQNLFDELHRAFLPNDGANHHFIVTNKGPNPLWVFVYYFDPATYTVAEFYAPPSNTMEPPLKPNNKLIIGNANSGVHPFSFIMKEGLEEDSGFAKIFVSETYTDLAMLEEQDEFIYVDPRRTRAGTALSKHGVWDSMVTTITVRR